MPIKEQVTSPSKEDARANWFNKKLAELFQDFKVGTGSLLRRKRRGANLTIDDLSVLTGVSSSTIWELEANEKLPKYESFRKLLTPMGVEQDSLMLIYNWQNSWSNPETK